jgi:RimJ/RimL family protein N-acetyltransferase
VIETARLQIVPFSEAFLTDRYVGWLNDPQVTRYSEQRHRRHTLESCREYLESFRGTPHFFWAICEKPGLEHIGNINAYVDERHQIADVGILIGERGAQGRGLGGEAWSAVCDFLLRSRGMRKVTAGTIEPNAPMLAVMKRAGMKADGRRPRHMLWEGREVDMIQAALFRDGP